MSTYKQFSTDKELETNGVVHDLGAAGRFRLARAGGSNERYNKRIMQLTKPFRRAIATNTMDSAEAERITAKVFAETVVLGWEGVTGPDGSELPYSVDNAVMLFTDLPDLFAELRAAATDASIFRSEELKVEAGN